MGEDVLMALIEDLFKKRSSSLVLLGGNTGSGEHADAIYKKISDLAGGKNGKIGVITSANDPYDWDRKERGEFADDSDAKNSKMAANRYIKRFKQQGVKAEWIPIDLANKPLANAKDLAKRIDKGEFTGFFFGGGKQTYHLECLSSETNGVRIDSLVLTASSE